MTNDPMNALFEADARFENLIWLPGIACADDAPEVFEEEFLECLPSKPESDIYRVFPWLWEYEGDVEEALDRLRSAKGFLVQGATPSRRYEVDGETYTSGWGIYKLTWLYAASIEQAAHDVAAWAERMHEEDRQRSLVAP